MAVVKIYAMIAVFLVISGLGYYAKVQTERAAKAEQAVESYTAALEEQNKAVVEFQFKLEKREKARKLATREAAKWRMKWREVQRNDPIVKEWTDTPTPIPVRGVVCDIAKCDSGKEAGTEAIADTDPPVRPD